MVNTEFWKGRKVFLTGHTGFKGSWLSIWLTMMGAEVTGYALAPPTSPSLFDLADIKSLINHNEGDIRDIDNLIQVMKKSGPEVVIHMAAQPLVRESYSDPVTTYSTNVMGVVNLFEAVRQTGSVKSVVNVTTDKCYENKEWVWGYREDEAMGGYDPYSNSKGCSELVTAAYRSSFFNPQMYGKSHSVALASARAGNVIGGGDWAVDRLIPDICRSILEGSDVLIRNPHAIRPWQHVLEPLSGYLVLAEKLYTDGVGYAEGWNFGPEDSDAKPVEWIVQRMCAQWQGDVNYVVDSGDHPHEAHYLKLDISKAKMTLGWTPTWSIAGAIEKIIMWLSAYKDKKNMLEITQSQIHEYLNDSKEKSNE